MGITLPAVGEVIERGKSRRGHKIWGMVVEKGFNDDSDYHDRSELSHSQFKSYLAAPEKFEREVIQGEPKQFSKATQESLKFGTATETMLFTGRLPGDPMLIPDDVLSKRKKTAAWFSKQGLDPEVDYDPENPEHHSYAKSGKAYSDFAAQHAGRKLLKRDEWAEKIEPLRRVATQVREHDDARALIKGPGENHVAIVFGCPWTGMELRCQLDRVSYHARRLVDIKTTHTTDPDTFSKTIYTLGYHIQALWYRTAVYSVTGVWYPWTFVVIRNKAPYNVETYTLDSSWYDLADEEIEPNLKAIKESIEQGRFRTPTHGRTWPLSPPPWAKPRGAARRDLAIKGAAD